MTIGTMSHRTQLTVFLLATLVGSHLQAGSRSTQATGDREDATAQYFERVRDNPVELAGFLERMPLGADLHHHLTGGVRPAVLIRMAAAAGLCLPAAPHMAWFLRPPPCGDHQRPVAEALVDTALHREIERRWSMQDYLADDASIDRIKANDHFFAIFRKLQPLRGELSRLVAAARTLAARQGVIYLETATGYTPAPESLDELSESIRWNDDLATLRHRVLSHPLFAELRDGTVEALPRAL